MRLQGLNVYFDPGSTAVKILDRHSGQARAPVTADVVSFTRLADALPNIDALSTAMVPADVPQELADRYRLFLVLMNSSKPIVTGTFTVEGFAVMKEMLVAVTGSEERLRECPPAIFDACPSPPLKWSTLTSQTLLDCARCGLPAELISMPLLGATSPVTISGALVQHTAESLSGLVIHQLAGPGSPIIYGGAPEAFDMRHGTTATGAIETVMLTCAYAQIGRYFDLPTHGYLGLSDAKVPDAQAGLESGISAVMAAMTGINVVSGPGMLEFVNCQSMEKLVIDDEICGMTKRLLRGIEPREQTMAADLFGEISDGQHFLTSPTTLRWLREEITFPSSVIDRRSRGQWEAEGRKDAAQTAAERVDHLLESHRLRRLPDDVRGHLTEIMTRDARLHGCEIGDLG